MTIETENGLVLVPKGSWAVFSDKGFYHVYEDKWFQVLFELVAYVGDAEKIH